VKRCTQPGVVIGLAWTPVGGEVLFIEATAMPGRGALQITGKLGEVMSESARIAHSLLKSRAARYEIPPKIFDERDIHLHVPAGAIPKRKHAPIIVTRSKFFILPSPFSFVSVG
jgi:ATP-dependent Lon protease